MNDRDTAAALASALPSGIAATSDESMSLWRDCDIAEFQAEHLAEYGYVLLHGEHVDEATVERVARMLAIKNRPQLSNPAAIEAETHNWRWAARAVLAALAAPADEQAEVDRG